MPTDCISFCFPAFVPVMAVVSHLPILALKAIDMQQATLDWSKVHSAVVKKAAVMTPGGPHGTVSMAKLSCNRPAL